MVRVTETVGDIFSAPPNTVLVHACNCRGAWGSGVALEFKKRYPQAFQIYNKHCTSRHIRANQASLLGTAFLIPPDKSASTSFRNTDLWIACLFTSVGYGRNVSEPAVILESTEKAMKDLAQQLDEVSTKTEPIERVWAVKINSGRFGVDWQDSKRILEGGNLDLTIVSPPRENDAGSTTVVEAKEPVGAKGTGTRGRKRKANGDRDVQRSRAIDDITTSDQVDGINDIADEPKLNQASRKRRTR